MSIKSVRLVFIFLMLVYFPQGLAHASLNREVHTLHHYHFSTPLGLESKVNFWKKIYSEYSTDHFVVHDMENLNIVYEVVFIKNSSKLSRKAKERKLKLVERKYQKLLLQIARTENPLTLKVDAKRVYHLVNSNFKKASRRIRVQIGQKDRFKAGLERSGGTVWHMGCANIGRRPTFSGTNVVIEAHLFDFADDIYDQPFRVALVDYLRPEKKFSGIAELQAQIAKDCKAARSLLESILPGDLRAPPERTQAVA